MAAKGKTPRIKARRSIAELEAELLKRTAERDEALAQQTATAQVLQVINSSPGDLAPVFEALLDKALTLCGGTFGIIRIYDGNSFHLGAMRGVPLEIAELMKQPRRPPFTGMVALERMVAGEPVVEIGDPRDLAGYRAGAPTIQAMVDRGGARTGLWVALRKDAELLGFIWVYRQEVRPFTDKQIALLQNFAAQAVIAMENARLLTETREALEQQTATAEVLQVINASPGDLAPVFDAILEKARQRTDAIHGDLWIYDGECFHLASTHGEPGMSQWLQQQGPLRPWPGSRLEDLLNGEDYVHLDDALQSASFQSAPEFLEQNKIAGIRTILSVPLRKEGVVLGLITVYRRKVRPFTDKQIALLQNFAAQAVIAMENARLLTETREALEQQTATAEVLQVINSSPGELAPVFDAILEKAHALCGAASGGLLIRDGEAFRIAAFHGAPSILKIWRQTHPGRLPEGSPIARIVGGERIVHLTDALADESYRTAPAPIQRSLEADAIRTVLMVPLRKDGTLLGVITAFRQEVRPFTDKQIALLQNFAAQAVIAMENARLLTETREALEQQTATAEVLQVINSSPGDLAPVFDAMLDKATRLCEAPFGILRTWDGERFHFGAVHGEPTFRDWVRQRGPTRPDRDNSPLGQIVTGERVVRFADEPGDEGYWNSTGFREMVEASGIRRGIWVALRKDDELLGTITVYRREARPFSDKQIALLDNFAMQAVIAMENARLLSELRQRTEEVAELNRGLEARVAEQVDELGRVGRLKRFCRAPRARRERECHLYFARRVTFLSCADKFVIIADRKNTTFRFINLQASKANTTRTRD